MNARTATRQVTDNSVYVGEGLQAEQERAATCDIRAERISNTLRPCTDQSKKAARVALIRLNFMLPVRDSQWLDDVVYVFAERGVRISRSEILRAAIAALREVQDLSTRIPTVFSMDSARDGTQLATLAFLAVRSLYVGRPR